MRILLVAHRFGPGHRGGVETWTASLQAGLRALGHEAIVLTRDDTDLPPFTVRERDDGVLAIQHRFADARSHRETWADPRMEQAVWGALRLARPDVVHVAHSDGFGAAPLRLGRRLGLATVATLHDAAWICGRGQMVRPPGRRCDAIDEDLCVRCLSGQLERGPLRGLAARLAPAALSARVAAADASEPPEGRRPPSLPARRRWRARKTTLVGALSGVDFLTSPSRFLAERYREAGVASPILVLPNGVDALAVHPLPPWPLKVGWFGVPTPTKGLSVLLDAIRGIDPGRLTLAVHGPVDPALGSPPHVTLRGPYPPDEVAARMAEVHLVCLPSTWDENQPLVALEAQAAGRPLLASRVGGLPELIRDGVDGWLVPPGDAAALRAALLRLADAPRILRAAAAAIRPPPTATAMARAFAALYESALSGLVPTERPTTAV